MCGPHTHVGFFFLKTKRRHSSSVSAFLRPLLPYIASFPAEREGTKIPKKKILGAEFLPAVTIDEFIEGGTEEEY